MLKILAFTALAAFAGGAALAQDADYVGFVERTNAAVPPPTVEALAPEALGTLQAIARQRNACVPTGVQMEAPRTAIAVRAITVGVNSGQIKNGWTAYGRAEGCPNPPRLRFLVLRMADDSLRAVVVNEGETLTNPSLMRDTSAVAAMAALQVVRAADATCSGQDMDMGPTRIAERGADLGPDFHGTYYAGSWSEVWTFSVCGRSAEVPVRFTADGQGGANYNVVGTEVRLVGQ
jgi:hypothetical protein